MDVTPLRRMAEFLGHSDVRNPAGLDACIRRDPAGEVLRDRLSEILLDVVQEPESNLGQQAIMADRIDQPHHLGHVLPMDLEVRNVVVQK